MLALDPAVRIDHQGSRTVSPALEAPLHRFHEPDVLGQGGIGILFGEAAKGIGVLSADREPLAGHLGGPVVDRPPVVGVQHVPGIDLEGEGGPQEPRAVFQRPGMGAGFDAVAHGFAGDRLRRVAQHAAPGDDTVAVGVDHAARESGVVHPAVVALVVVLHRHLPVASLDDAVGEGGAQSVQVGNVLAKRRPEPGVAALHRLGVRIQVYEHEAAHALDAHRGQAYAGGVEARHPIDAGRGAQAAVELIGPGVVGTHQHPPVPSSGHQLMGAVRARVVERRHRAIGSSHAEEAPAVHVEGEVVARLLELRNVAGVLPGAAEDPLAFTLEASRIGVVRGVESVHGRVRGLLWHVDHTPAGRLRDDAVDPCAPSLAERDGRYSPPARPHVSSPPGGSGDALLP